MKPLLLTVAVAAIAVALTACGQSAAAPTQPKSAPQAVVASAPSSTADDMASMPGMKGQSMDASTPSGAEQSATATGVIIAIDTAAGTVTLKHGPIAGIGWPAMTMAFKADPPALIKNLKVGQTVGFTLTGKAPTYRVTAINPS
jgi:Cu(I)/Ag(I) efflux system protein CusF